MKRPANTDAPDRDTLRLLRWGALTVRGAAKFSGIGRTELFELMRDGHLPWFKHGTFRMIPRRALVELLARMYAARGANARTD